MCEYECVPVTVCMCVCLGVRKRERLRVEYCACGFARVCTLLVFVRGCMRAVCVCV